MDEKTHGFHGIEWRLITNYINGESSEAERRQVEEWVGADPSRKAKIESLQSIRDARGERDLQSQTKAAWDEVLCRTRSLPQEGHASTAIKLYPLFLRAMQIAAAILLIVGLPYAIVKLKNLKTESKAQPTMCIVSTDPGQRANIRLSDGTAVTLNSMSTLEFPEQFENGPREVVLVGEAYFAVTQKEGVPFFVRTARAVVQVLGTEFNVSAWPADESDEVVVARGKVSVQSAQTGVQGSVILTQGQETRIVDGKAPSIPRIVSIQKYSAWLHGQLMFDNTPFRDVIKTLERQYDFKCNVRDSSLLTYRITASFKNESLGEILRLMSASMGAQYEHRGPVATFYLAAKKRSR
jgi:ferric-dicitrate binding protein FerR (iron transport regulator)